MRGKVILTAMIATLYLGFAPKPAVHAMQDPQRIEITAKRYMFTPNEVTVKVNQPAVLVFKSEDATHGMHFDDLKIEAVIEKGKGAEVPFTPDTVGDFVGHCAVFCGAGHGGMMLTIHVVE
jgi:cytochrome c oxidase subunit 2